MDKKVVRKGKKKSEGRGEGGEERGVEKERKKRRGKGKEKGGERVKWREQVNHHPLPLQSLPFLTSSPGPRSLSCLVTMSMSTIMSVV